mmetsp:Transcript_86259/g.264045  ORF Transcript_86259/g.264045 Transcript_86259/m.264045 type:complete len:354 (+) Transcript_86259:126-1187(+)
MLARLTKAPPGGPIEVMAHRQPKTRTIVALGLQEVLLLESFESLGGFVELVGVSLHLLGRLLVHVHQCCAKPQCRLIGSGRCRFNVNIDRSRLRLGDGLLQLTDGAEMQVTELRVVHVTILWEREAQHQADVDRRAAEKEAATLNRHVVFYVLIPPFLRHLNQPFHSLLGHLDAALVAVGTVQVLQGPRAGFLAGDHFLGCCDTNFADELLVKLHGRTARVPCGPCLRSLDRRGQRQFRHDNRRQVEHFFVIEPHVSEGLPQRRIHSLKIAQVLRLAPNEHAQVVLRVSQRLLQCLLNHALVLRQESHRVIAGNAFNLARLQLLILHQREPLGQVWALLETDFGLDLDGDHLP